MAHTYRTPPFARTRAPRSALHSSCKRGPAGRPPQRDLPLVKPRPVALKSKPRP